MQRHNTLIGKLTSINKSGVTSAGEHYTDITISDRHELRAYNEEARQILNNFRIGDDITVVGRDYQGVILIYEVK